MPKINVYLPEDLAEAVRDSGIPVSAVCQRALEHEVRRLAAAREAVRGRARTDSFDTLFPAFTPRARTVLRTAARARGTDAHITTADLLAALVSEDSGPVPRVLGTLEIDPVRITTALADRDTAEEPGPSDPPAFSAPAAAALEAALTEAIALGHDRVDCEHLLLGLVAHGHGAGGALLRDLGADQRGTRRAVASALTGHVHPGSRHGTSGAAPAPEDALDARLSPLLARIERLEERLDARG
ncbi:hypothetical protein SUDANB121_00327 [Nocardiopsis dassonvillei]|uniref:Clp protease N-terminal domain-containing protein n=1 Tax=Nocardiopsis dassonvillei TaxID=2014 RepID=UPI003F551193